MKKILVLVLLLTLFGCQKEKEYDELGNEIITDQEIIDEKIITLINQCITSYNEDKISDLEQQLNTTLPQKPINVKEIEPIKNLNNLSKETDLTSNADYIYRYKIDDTYSIVFRLYEPLSDFWMDGKATFEVNPLKIERDVPEYNSIKNTLDGLLDKNAKTINLLYGADLELGENNPNNPKYFEVISFEGNPLNSIAQIKELAEEVFSQQLLASIYEVSFGGDSPIYMEENNKLYVQESHITTKDTIPYDTSLIIASEKLGATTRIDILASFGENIMPEIFRINLIEESGRLVLDRSY